MIMYLTVGCKYRDEKTEAIKLETKDETQRTTNTKIKMVERKSACDRRVKIVTNSIHPPSVHCSRKVSHLAVKARWDSPQKMAGGPFQNGRGFFELQRLFSNINNHL
jgi:hypothetical protein